MPRLEREWLSWTNSTSTPSSRPAPRAEGLDQEAALVAVDLGLEQDDARRASVIAAAVGISRARAVLALVVLAVLARADRPPPPLVVAIPLDGALDPVVEADRRLPAERLEPSSEDSE